MITLRDHAVGTLASRLVGLAFGIIGLSLAALAGFIVWDSMEPGLAALLVVVVSISWFCSSTGWRLALNRPNRYGSIIRPWAWRTLGAISLVLAITFVVIAWTEARLLSAWPTLVAVAFALLCFWRARMLSRPLQPSLPSNPVVEITRAESVG